MCVVRQLVTLTDRTVKLGHDAIPASESENAEAFLSGKAKAAMVTEYPSLFDSMRSLNNPLDSDSRPCPAICT